MSETTPQEPDPGRDVVVIGAGPAGLTAAFQLHKHGVASTVLEADEQVGGISRTVERDGWRFDIGGHRFFTKVPEVEDLWHEILPDEDFLMRPRKSRIFYNGKYFDYPLSAFNALKNVGPVEAVACVGSYLWATAPPAQGPDQLRGLARRPLRLAALPDVLQDLHREAVGRPGQRDARRLGGAAGQGPVARQRHRQRPHAEAEPEGHHLAHRGVPVPEVRAGDDVGGLPGQGRGPGLQGRAWRPR